MIRIAALNDSSYESSNDEDNGPSEEALEAAATALYRNAIAYLAKGESQKAQECFLEVLRNPYTEKACWKEGNERPTTLPQEIALKYSCLKNLANILMQEKNYENACQYYLKAVELDPSEVTLWYKLGTAAIKIKDFELAVIAFQEGLQVNSSHWPCLDQLLSVLFLLGLYDDCLGLAIYTLKRDPCYIKALAFKDKIFDLQPSMIAFAKEFYIDSHILFEDVQYDKSKGNKFIETCLELRPLPKPPLPSTKIPSRRLQTDLEMLNWVQLADSLADTYDHLINEDAMTFAARLELESHVKEYINSKFGYDNDAEHNFIIKPGRRLSRSLSCSEVLRRRDCESDAHDPGPECSDIADNQGSNATRAKIVFRRQTIELGESQESFRVCTRRSFSLERESTELKVRCGNADDRQQELHSVNDTKIARQDFAINVTDKGEKQDIMNDASKEAISSLAATGENANNESLMEDFIVESEISKSKHEISTLVRDSLSRDQKQKETEGRVTDTPSETGLLTQEKLVLEPSADSHISTDSQRGTVMDMQKDSIKVSISDKVCEDKTAEATNVEFSAKADDSINSSELLENDKNVCKKDKDVKNNEEKQREISEAAVNQLNDIMSFKAPAEILGLAPPPVFEFEGQEFSVEYFDGGVYEDDDDDDDDELEVEVCERDEENAVTGSKELKEKDPSEPVKEKEHHKSLEDMAQLSNNQLRDEGKELSRVTVEETQSKEAHATQSVRSSAAEKPVVKKQKRPKRGLERELEQLDYWGRRKAREAKRRRQTLTSKLVGAFEENEYLTWAHLLRSFVPAALLLSSESSSCSSEAAFSENDTKSNVSLQNSTTKNKEARNSLPSEDTKKSLGEREAESESGHQLSEIPSQNEAVRDQCYSFVTALCPNCNVSQWNSEELQVGEFLYRHQRNGGIIEVMQKWQNIAIEKYKKIWPLNLALAYKNVYARVRRHIVVEPVLCPKANLERLYSYATSALTHLELLVSLHHITDKVSELKEDPDLKPEELFVSQDLHIEDDIFNLGLMLGRPDVWREEYLQAHLRLRWVQSQIQLALGHQENSVAQLSMLIEEMVLSTNEEEEEALVIDCCKVDLDDTSVTLAHLKSKLTVLQRSQMLESVEGKYRDGYYEEVVNILVSLFDNMNSQSAVEGSCPPRPTQLVMLVESLIKCNNILGLIEWSGKCLSEAIENFKKIEICLDEVKMQWSTTVEAILLALLKTFKARPSVDGEKVLTKLPSFISPLVDVSVLQLEQTSGSCPYFNTLSVWILLHYTLSEYEQSQASRNSIQNTEAGEQCLKEKIADDISSSDQSLTKEKTVCSFPSTLLLITAHEELGKNGWCCHEEGILMFHMMEVLLAELKRPLSEEQRLLLHQSLEQVIFCLYGHPSRKTKYKHLRDHGTQTFPLTWDRALQLCKYYLPSQLPDFQSSQIPSVSDDMAALFKKVLCLLPSEFRHTEYFEHVESYLLGETKRFSGISHDFPTELTDCYYLLGDYHFKGKEWDVAIYYYKMDVCINPNRIDSWAPMGLAKKAKLETLLNSCDVIANEEQFFKEAEVAARCLDKALQLDQYHSNLWVEKGGLVYMIYSHASRLLKQDLNPDLSIERFEILEKIKEDMMEASIGCFTQALEIVEQGLDDESLPDERWLYHYMLGKLAEKSNKPPKVVLDYYLTAAGFLHKIGAKYPNKISYNNPQEYAVEAMELYFRMHTFIFKFLHQREGRELEREVMLLFGSIVDELSQSPFVKGQERKDTKISANESSLADSVQDFRDMTASKRAADVTSGKDECAAKKQKTEETTENFISNIVNSILDSAVSRAQKEKKNDSDDKDEHIETGERHKIIMKCIDAWKLCISRFSHHYKSFYRIAYYYHHSKFHKDNIKSHNFLLGTIYWQRLDYLPCDGLFHDRKIYLPNLKNCNLFNGVWRIPHDEIDRPGSFAAHMYRCVSLCLDILQDMKDFYTVLEVALALKNSPDKDKKYLRDNERELLSEHSTQVGLQLMKDKFKILFTGETPSPPGSVQNNRQQTFLIEVHKAYKYMSRHMPCVEGPSAKILVDSYAVFKNLKVDNNATLLREADNYCMRNSYIKRPPAPVPPPQTSLHGTNQRILPPTPVVPGMAKRGRPPVPPREQVFSNSGATKDITSNPGGHSVAVQQAYKIYENLIHIQTVLNEKNFAAETVTYYEKKCEDYKQQMLKYLQIPSVSQFFHASLQSMGSSAAKLPPPPSASQNVVASVGKTDVAEDKHSITSLAARSQAHGISISAVSKKNEIPASKAVKPNMSVTVSPTKSSDTLIKLSGPISQPLVLSPSKTPGFSLLKVPKDISIVRTSPSKQSNAVISKTPPLPKLPAGTTLSRQNEGGGTSKSSLASSASSYKSVEISKISGSVQHKPVNRFSVDSQYPKVSKGSVTVTPSVKNLSNERKPGPVSAFQNAFQASLAQAKQTFPISLSSLKKESVDQSYKGKQLSSAEVTKRASGLAASTNNDATESVSTPYSLSSGAGNVPVAKVTSNIAKSSDRATTQQSFSSSSSNNVAATKATAVTSKGNRMSPEVVPIVLRDPLALATTSPNEEEEIITLD